MEAPVLHPALVRLVFAQSRGKFRRALRAFRTPKRAILSTIAVGLVLLWLCDAAIAVALRPAADPDAFRAILPLVMFGIALAKLALLIVSREKVGVDFRPAEVELLEAGPFLRSDVRAYKTAGHAVSIVITALVASFFLWADVQYWLAGFVGALLTMMFNYLLYMIVAVAAVNVSQKVYNWSRVIACGAMTAVLGYCLTSGVAVTSAAASWTALDVSSRFLASLMQLSETLPARLALAPYHVFTRVMVAPQLYPEGLIWTAAGAIVVLGAALFLLRLETYLVARRAAAERAAYDACESHAGLEKRCDDHRGRRHLPRLAWCGGAGPIAWRQLTGALRHKFGLALFAIVFVAFAGSWALALVDGREWDGLRVVFLIGVLTNFVLPTKLTFDFRRDVTRISALKTLPIPTRGIVIGQLMTPVLMSVLIQAVVVAALATVYPHLLSSLIVGMLFLVPANFVIFGLENLIFLLYPYHTAEYDLQASVRRIVTLFAKVVFLVITLLMALAIALVVVLSVLAVRQAGGSFERIAQHGHVILITSWWFALVALAAGLVYLLSWAYRRYDPALDNPV